MGPSTLAGTGIMVLMVPGVKLVVNILFKLRKKRVIWSDIRVENISSMINSIKYCKLNHLGDKFAERVMNARKNEVKLVKKELSIIAITLFLTVITPSLGI